MDIVRSYFFLGVLLGLPVSVFAESYEFADKAEHIVLISIDGHRSAFYLDAERWPAPMLQYMAREGLHAEATRAVFPSNTYPSHTTIITGALPARHGILHNTRFRPAPDRGSWYFHYDYIQTETLNPE